MLHLIDTGGPGGAETVFLHLVTRLDTSRYRSIPVVSRDGWLAEQLQSRGVSPLIVPSRGSVNVPYLLQLARLIRTHRVDAVIAHLYGSAIYGSLAGMLTHRPAISILHGQTDVSPSERFASAKAQAVRRGSKRVVFVSKQLQSALQARLQLRDEQCVVIENGVDIAAFSARRDDSIRRELGLSPSTLLVGAIGNIRAPKGYDTLVSAAGTLCRENDRFHFVIAGEGSGKLLEKLLAQRSELGLDQRVTFLGSRSDVARILNGLDIYTLSSTTEGFSIACVEAMACGLPVVATRSGGPQTIIDDGRSGLLVDPSEPQQLAAAIRRLADNPALGSELGRNARAATEQRFSLKTMIDNYDALLGSAIDS